MEIQLMLFLLCFVTHVPTAVLQTCHRNVTGTDSCITLTSTTCLGTTLSFTHTSLIFANDSADLASVYDKLTLWKGLQAAPLCWEVVQPYLCSIYLPTCDNSASTVELPSKEVCKKAQEECSIVDSFQGWPDFLQCSKEYFAENCQVFMNI